jgi:hypothetical protein
VSGSGIPAVAAEHGPATQIAVWSRLGHDLGCGSKNVGGRDENLCMLPHRGSQARVDRRTQHTEPSSWAPVGWFTLVVVTTSVTWALCLPQLEPYPSVVPAPGQVFHLEWFLMATVLGYVIWHAARSSWLVGVASTLLASVQMLGIADDGAGRLQQVGMVSAETDMLFLIAGLQVLLFVAAGAIGIRHSLANRRFVKLNRRLAALDAPSSRRTV